MPDILKELEKIRQEIEKKHAEASADIAEETVKRLINRFPNLVEYTIREALKKTPRIIIDTVDYAFNTLPKETKRELAEIILKNIPSDKKIEYLSEEDKIKASREVINKYEASIRKKK